MALVVRVCLIALCSLGLTKSTAAENALCSAVRSPMTVLGPEVAIPGQISAVQVTLHDKHDHNVTLLFSCPKTSNLEPLAQNTVRMQEHGTVTLAIPCQVSGLCQLEVLLDCPEALLEAESRASCLGLVSAPVRVVGSVRDVIIRPAASHYRPGDELSFWVLALDRDLRIASDILANIYVRDPAGVKVKLWNQVLFTTGGAKQYSLPLSPYARPGLWTLEVVIEGEIFSRTVNVSTQSFRSSRRVAIAQRHYVELRFMGEMKKTYKPGLPFVGMIESVSSEKAIRVRVKVLDDVTAIYSQDIEMVHGEGMFVVPAVISDADHIVIQAELVSVDGKEIDSHYILAKEVIKKWSSISDCYLLIEGVQHTLQPQETTQAIVISSCPCSQHLHYMIVTEGHVTSWSKDSKDEMSGVTVGQHIFDNATSTSVCKFNFSFAVDSSMAPVSNLVVYYVDENQTVVADLASFRVNLSNNKISTVFDSEKHYSPGEKIEMQVFAEQDSTVCLIGGRAGDSYFEHRFPYKELDLAQAGVSQFDPALCSTSSSHHPKHRHHHYSVFPDTAMDTTWLWRCFNYTKDTSARKLKISAPRAPGKYFLRSLMLSSSTGNVLASATPSGLRYSEPALIKVFAPLSVEFHMPEHIRTGEVLQVDVSVENNVNDCVDVSAILTLNGGALFYGTNQAYIGEKLRLGPQGATSIVVKFVSSSPGYNNFTAEVTGFVSESCQAQKSPHSDRVQQVWNEEALGTFIQSSSILVLAEAQVKTRTESAYFCANEQLVTLTASDNHYKWLPAPRNKDGVFISMTSSSDVTIVLNSKGKTSPQMYSVTLGPNKAAISRGKHAHGIYLTQTSVPNLLSSDTPSVFWITWDSGLLTVGRQWEPHNQTLLQWPLDKKLKVNNVGFKSAFGHPAQFRIWNYNEEAGFSQVLHLDVPRSILPGTERGLLLLAGGLALPSYLPLYYPVRDNTPTRAAHTMRSLPRALAQYTSLSTLISSFAPALLLDTDPSLLGLKPELLKHLEQNLQRLYQYRLPDHSFGDHCNTSSMWDTISVLELLTDIQSSVSVDPDVYASVKRTVQNYQKPDGSFSGVDATAFALSVLVQVGVENDNDSLVISRAQRFLESQELTNTTDSLSLAMTTYALVLTKSERAQSWLAKLRALSSNEEGDFGWTRGEGRGEWIYEDQMLVPNGNENSRGLLRDYRASLYCLLIHTKLKDLESAEPVAKYLTYRIHVLDNHSELLYSALKSLSQFSSLADDTHRSLTVSLATSNMELTDTLELRTMTAPCPLELPSLPTKVFVYSTGAGCATIQGLVTYSTYSVQSANAVLEIGGQVLQEFLPGRPQSAGKYPRLLLKTCLRWKGQTPSGVVKLEVFLFSGYTLESVQHVNPATDIMYDSRGDQVWFVFPNLKSTCVTCLEYFVQTRYSIESLRPVFARAYPASEPYMGVATFFHTSLDSPLTEGATRDDFETWFGANYTERQNIFQDECECHRSCHHKNRNHTTSSKTTARTLNTLPTPTTEAILEMEITRENFAKKLAKKLSSKVPSKEMSSIDTQDKNTNELFVQSNRVQDVDTTTTISSSVNSTTKTNPVEDPEKTVDNFVRETKGNRVMDVKTTTSLPVTSETVDTNRVQELDRPTTSPSATTPQHDIVITFVDGQDDGVNKTDELVRAKLEPKIVIDDIKEDLVVTFAPQIIVDRKNKILLKSIDPLQKVEEVSTTIQTDTNAVENANAKIKSNEGTKSDSSMEKVISNEIQNTEKNTDKNILNKLFDHKVKKYNNLVKALTNLKTLSKGLLGMDESQSKMKADVSKDDQKGDSHTEKTSYIYTNETNLMKNNSQKDNIYKTNKSFTSEQSNVTVLVKNQYVYPKDDKKSSSRVESSTKIKDVDKIITPSKISVDKLLANKLPTKKDNSTEGTDHMPHVDTRQPLTKSPSRTPVKRHVPEYTTTESTAENPSSPLTIDTTKLIGTTQRSELNEVDTTTPHHRAYFHLIQSDEITITKPIDVKSPLSTRDNSQRENSSEILSTRKIAKSAEVTSELSSKSASDFPPTSIEATETSSSVGDVPHFIGKNPSDVPRTLIGSAKTTSVEDIPRSTNENVSSTQTDDFPSSMELSVSTPPPVNTDGMSPTSVVVDEISTQTPLETSSQLIILSVTETSKHLLPDDVITPRALPSSENEDPSPLEEILLRNSEGAVLVRQERVKKTVSL